jgi:hypothetical protein
MVTGASTIRTRFSMLPPISIGKSPCNPCLGRSSPPQRQALSTTIARCHLANGETTEPLATGRSARELVESRWPWAGQAASTMANVASMFRDDRADRQVARRPWWSGAADPAAPSDCWTGFTETVNRHGATRWPCDWSRCSLSIGRAAYIGLSTTSPLLVVALDKPPGSLASCGCVGVLAVDIREKATWPVRLIPSCL